ncbi:hypothetical protein V493_05447, partial [Pseudogymnoascus sp. VKM F-4281 (FW-2241)]
MRTTTTYPLPDHWGGVTAVGFALRPLVCAVVAPLGGSGARAAGVGA